MTNTELARFGEILRAKQFELARGTLTRDIIAIERTADEVEEAQHRTAREIAVVRLNRESTVRRSVAMGLFRLQDGTFGTCIHCGEDISQRRLEAIPWTPFCIHCQEAADRGDGRSLEEIEHQIAVAA